MSYKFPSGLLVRVLRKGTGSKTPLLTTPCTCHYEGRFTDGNIFDSSYARREPIDFAPNQVIPAWTEALQKMVEGDQWEITCPYNIAYGEAGIPPTIPPRSTLIFKMELLKIKGGSKAAPENVFADAVPSNGEKQ